MEDEKIKAIEAMPFGLVYKLAMYLVAHAGPEEITRILITALADRKVHDPMTSVEEAEQYLKPACVSLVKSLHSIAPVSMDGHLITVDNEEDFERIKDMDKDCLEIAIKAGLIKARKFEL